MRLPTGYSSWLLTINNPLKEENLTHDVIKEKLFQIKSLTYFCFSDEIGAEQGTAHTHVFFACSKDANFNVIKSLFPTAHIDKARGSAFDNKAYITKTGRWSDTSKAETSVAGTFYEWGVIIPTTPHIIRFGLSEVYSLIKAGLSNYDILGRNKEYLLIISEIQQLREAYSKES